jgi:enoyl-CoA hydratase/carnithine racemase
MTSFAGRALAWSTTDRVVEVALRRPPANEIGTEMLADLERLADSLPALEREAAALVLHGALPAGFSAGADLRELHARIRGLGPAERVAGVRDFLRRIHRVLDALDASPLTTIAAVHGVVFGGGLELALACDVIVADRLARFGFPELRLGLVPGFGGIARLSRDVGNGVVRDLLLTGRSLNAPRAHALGLVSQVVAEGQALPAARSAAAQAAKFDRRASAAAKGLAKPVPRAEIAREIDVFCELFARPEVEAALERFVRSRDPLPYLP